MRGSSGSSAGGSGLEVGKHALESFGFLAGQDAARAADLQAAIADPGVRAIFCTRGGYGITRILDVARLRSAREGPEAHRRIQRRDRVALRRVERGRRSSSFHGPMVAGDNLDAPKEELQRALLFEPAASARAPRRTPAVLRRT